MINAIKSDPNLTPFIKQKSECCYDGKPEHPYIDNDIHDDSVVALAPDEYYNSLHLSNTPPSIDYLVTLESKDKGFAHFLIEDKNVKRASGIDVNNIYRKFKTTLEDFMSERFGQLFLDEAYPIFTIRLYLVSNLEKPSKKEDRTGKGMRLEILQTMLPFKFRGIRVTIDNSDPKVLVKRY